MQGTVNVCLEMLTVLVCNPIVMSAIVIMLIVYIKNNIEFKKSSYYDITHNSYLSVRFDNGKYGEYLTYKYLKKFEKSGAKFLFNAYIPRENGETNEIDVLMICSNGIFVFESKNYSGWIFGSENQKNWYQTLPAGRGKSRKESFYNPIMQNRTHIKYLKNLLDMQVPINSIIVFSDRCTLKSIQTTSSDVKVINRYNICRVVTDICAQTVISILSQQQIVELYNKIYPYTQVSENTKTQHIHNIQNKKKIEVMSTDENVAESQKLQCPKCGAELTLRTAKRGANIGNKFYGCSNYPKCRYIQEITKALN